MFPLRAPHADVRLIEDDEEENQVVVSNEGPPQAREIVNSLALPPAKGHHGEDEVAQVHHVLVAGGEGNNEDEADVERILQTLVGRQLEHSPPCICGEGIPERIHFLVARLKSGGLLTAAPSLRQQSAEPESETVHPHQLLGGSSVWLADSEPREERVISGPKVDGRHQARRQHVLPDDDDG